MKKILAIISLTIIIGGWQAWAAEVKISELPAVTSVAGSDVFPVVASGVTSKITATNLFSPYQTVAGLGASAFHADSYFQVNLSLIAGTMTNTYLCTYTTAGTLLDCNTNPATFQVALTNPITGTSTNHYWGYFTGATSLAGKSITASKPVCSDSSGDPGVCAGTEGVWQVAGSYQASSATLTSLASLTETNGGIPYGTADNTYAWLGAGATGKVFIAKGAAAPEWTPYTFPATVPTIGKTLISDGTNLIGSTALGTAAYAATGDFDAAGTAAGKIASSISDSDTTHCPDGNSVFDGLAGKQASGSYQADMGITGKTDSTSTTSSTVVASATAVKAAYDLANGRQPALSLLPGTYTNSYLCTYTTTGTLLDCNTNPASFQAAGSYQAADAELGYLAGLTFADASLIQLTGTTSAAVLTSGGNDYFLKSATDNSALMFATPAEVRTALGLVIGTNVQAQDAELGYLGGLTFADASLIQLTGTTSAAVLTSGGNNYFLASNSDNSALEFKTPANALTAIGAAPANPLATDTLWDAAGDLVQGSGANTAAKLTKGAEGTILRAGASSNAYSTSTFADTYAKGTFLYNASANTVASLAHPGAANYLLYTNAADTSAWLASSANMISLLGSADYATARTNLGLAIGSNVQAYDAELASIAGLTFADASIIQLTGAAASAVLTSGGNDYFLKSATDNSALIFATPAEVRTALGLVISTNVQAYDADLTTYAGITPSANIQTFLGSADYATARTNLGLGTMAVETATNYFPLSTIVAAGDVLVGTGAATPGVISKGTAYQLFQMDSGAITPEWTSTPHFSALDLSAATSSIPYPVGTSTWPTTEGAAKWDSTNNVLYVGDGAASKKFVPEGTATGGLILGDSSPDAAGEIGYDGALKYYDAVGQKTVANLTDLAAGTGLVERIGATFDGGGAAIAVNKTAYVHIPFAVTTINQWTVICDQDSGTTGIIITPYSQTYVEDDITLTTMCTTGTPPHTTDGAGAGGTSHQAAWDCNITSIAADSVVQFKVTTAPTSAQWCTVSLKVTR